MNIVSPRQQTLTDAATVAWNLALGESAKVTITDNRAIGVPTNPKAGGRYSIEIIQDGTGGRTVTWDAVFSFPDGAASLIATAGARNMYLFEYDGAFYQWIGGRVSGGGGGGEDLEATLANGNFSGPYHVEMQDGYKIKGEDAAAASNADGGSLWFELGIPDGTGVSRAVFFTNGVDLDGDPRGSNSFDFTTIRANADEVASGNKSYNFGYFNKIETSESIAMGTGISLLGAYDTGEFTFGIIASGGFHTITSAAPADWECFEISGTAHTITSTAGGGTYVASKIGGRNVSITDPGSFIASDIMVETMQVDAGAYFEKNRVSGEGHWFKSTSDTEKMDISGHDHQFEGVALNSTIGGESLRTDSASVIDLSFIHGFMPTINGTVMYSSIVCDTPIIDGTVSSSSWSGTGHTVEAGSTSQDDTVSGFGHYIRSIRGAIFGRLGIKTQTAEIVFANAHTDVGDCQSGRVPLRVKTTNGTATTAYIVSTEQHTIRQKQAYTALITVSAYQTGGASGTEGDSASWQFLALVRRNAAGTTTMIAIIERLTTGNWAAAALYTPWGASAAAATWLATPSVSGTELVMTVTGQASKNITWTITHDYVGAGGGTI